MKRTIVQIIFFIYCIANVYPQYSTIWQLGKTDNSSKEFALAPDGKDRFIISGFGDNKKYFYAGEHTPADFPYIIPGPTAEWAGSSYWAGQCRIQLPILIKLSDVNPLKKYQWNIFIENVEYEDCMFLRRKELRFSYKAWHQTANIFNTARNSKGRVQQDCNAVIQR